MVAGTLAYAFRRRKIDFGYIKPLETGIVDNDYLHRESDAALVKQAGALPEPLTKIVPYTFREALAPLLAARRQGIIISRDKLLNSIRKLIKPSRITIIEGAGGLLAPLCENYLVLNLIKELNFPTLVVCRTGLGSVNHTLLTLERLRREEIKPLGIIANHLSPEPGIAETTFISQLAEFDQVPILGELPYADNFQAEPATLDKLASHIDFKTLLRQIHS